MAEAEERPFPSNPEGDLQEFAVGDDYALNPDFVEMVADAADRRLEDRLRDLLDALRPEDLAELLSVLSPEHRRAVAPLLSSDDLAEVLSELEGPVREDVLERLEASRLAEAIGEMESDDAADVVDDLEAGKKDAVLAAMSETDRVSIETALGYADETAGRIMQREVVAAPQFWTVDQAVNHVRSRGDDLPDHFFEVYVVDPAYRPLGAASVSALLRARPEARLEDLSEPVIEIPVAMDQEEVGFIFDKYHLISAPVVDAAGRLVGQITVDDIVGVIRDEGEEDMLALAGVSDPGRGASLIETTNSRFWWLLVNLGTAILASGVIALYQGAIAKLAALAVLNPIAASMGGNAGTQTLTVAVRALATRELNASTMFGAIFRELAVGLINGVAFFVVIGLITLFWFHDPAMAVVAGLAMLINMIAAAFAGILLPLALDKMGFDPAASSVVFLTTVTDCVGYFSFLGLASWILLR